MDLKELQTPCLVLDREKLNQNISLLHGRMRALGVDLRPHGKTAKNIEIVRMALNGQTGGVTASTLREAEYFFENGIRDILYAVGIAPGKIGRAAQLVKRGASLTLVLDSVEQARHLSAGGLEHGLDFPILIELDCDGHRSGVTADDPALLEMGQYIDAAGGISLAGVLTHAGESYECSSTQAIRAIAREERDTAVKAAERLRARGLPCPIVSVGSTPTAVFAEDLSGVTEVRAGVFLFFDLVMAGLGVCTLDDIAVSVLTTVIGHQKEKGWIITDGGWMALSRDRGTASQRVDQGYGVVCDREGTPIPGLIVSAANQEHGIVSERSGRPIPWQDFPIGTVLRILPNHACATTAMHDEYHVVRGSAEVVGVLNRIRGW